MQSCGETWGVSFQQCHGVGRDALSLTGKAQVFLGGGLDAHAVRIHPQGAGNIGAHGLDMRSQFGRLAKHGASMFPTV